MLRRIDLFLPPNIGQYGVLTYFTKKFCEALSRTGVKCRMLTAQRDNPKPFLTEIFSDPPDCTLMFNGLLPDDQGRFFCDMIHIPHIAYLVDSPNHYLSLVRSPFTIIACVDGFAAEFFQGMGSQKAFFLPHGVEKNLAHDFPDIGRDFDVLMLSSCIDYEGLRKKWPEKYPANLRKVMEETCEIAWQESETSYVKAFVRAVNHYISGPDAIDPRTINFTEVLDDIEDYIRGKDRVDLVRSITDAHIQVFGTQDSDKGWGYYLKGKENVTIHQPVPYEQAIRLMQRSKIVLSSCAWIKNGVHERILSAMACGALVVTGENIYMKEHFKDEQEIVFYRPDTMSKINDKVNKYLANTDLLERAAQKGREAVLHGHTWDHRAAALIKDVTPILEKLKDQPKA